VLPVDTAELEQMSATELSELIQKAREIKKKKATPSSKINAYVNSVSGNVRRTLEAVKKLLEADGVPAKKWEEVEAQLGRLQLDVYRDEAAKITLRPTRRGGRRKKQA
jgi:hypothetical protein